MNDKMRMLVIVAQAIACMAQANAQDVAASVKAMSTDASAATPNTAPDELALVQTWLLPGAQRRFALLGIYGQAIFVDPALKLVMVHTAVGKDATGDASGNHLGNERDALWRGVVAHYGRW